jgi:hypothetical protein
MMRETATIRFIDVETGDEALTVVRAGQGQVALAVSLKQNGDLEVVLRPPECEQLITALQQAVVTARSERA